MNLLVTGGTGTLGRLVVKRLCDLGHQARVLTRRPGRLANAVQGDLKTGVGLEEAVADMDAVVHAATGVRQSLTSRSTDLGGTRRLIQIARKARIGHVVYVSIVVIDGVNFPYYRTRLAAEHAVSEAGVPWSILRATQFHDLMELFLRGFSMVPGVIALPFAWQFQPVDASDVADRVVEAALGKPAGRLPDFGGPEVRDFKSIAGSWLKARKETRRLVNLWLPFEFSRQVADGMLTTPEHRSGLITFEQYLIERYSPS